MHTVVIDFAAARARIEKLAEHSIEIPAARIPLEILITPDRPTMLERLSAHLSEGDIAELLHTTLAESL